MRILTVHNRYRHLGGEDLSSAHEDTVLRDHGWVVDRYTDTNARLEEVSSLAAAASTIWNEPSRRAIVARIREFKPDLLKIHNTMPLISPSVYFAAQATGVPVVQVLHNYRLVCAAGTLARNGVVCEDCLNTRIPIPALRHACYRQNRAATAAVATMHVVHRGLGTWQRRIQRYIALTGFAKEKFIEAGFPAEKIRVKPNFAWDRGVGAGQGGYALFVGRLSREKGLHILLEAWRTLKWPLVIIGEGPMLAEARETIASLNLSGIELRGVVPNEGVLEAMGQARCVVFPSIWYEGMPRTIIEAFAAGTPVIGSRLGAMQEMIRDGVNGFTFEPSNAAALAAHVDAVMRNDDLAGRLRAGARATYEANYTPEINYQHMVRIFSEVVEDAGRMELFRGPV